MLSEELKEKKRKREQVRRKEESAAYQTLSSLLRDVDKSKVSCGVVHHDSIRLSEDTPRLRVVDAAIHMIHRLQMENDYLRELLVMETECCSTNNRSCRDVLQAPTHSTTAGNAIRQARTDQHTMFYASIPGGYPHLQQYPGGLRHEDSGGTQHYGPHGAASSVGNVSSPLGPAGLAYHDPDPSSAFADGSYQFGAEYFLSDDIEPISCNLDVDGAETLHRKQYNV